MLPRTHQIVEIIQMNMSIVRAGKQEKILLAEDT